MADESPSDSQTITVTRGIHFLSDISPRIDDPDDPTDNDVSGYVVHFRVFRRVGLSALVELTVGAGVTLVAVEPGTWRILISTDQTASLPAGTYMWDFERTDIGPIQLAGGPFIVLDPDGPPPVVPLVCPYPEYLVSHGKVFKAELKPSRPAAVIPSGSPASIRMPLYAVSGHPAVVTAGGYCGTPVPDAKIGEAVFPQPVETAPTLSDDGTTVRVDLPSCVTNNPGVYELDARVLDAQGGAFALSRCWVYVEPSVMGGYQKGPPTVDDIRSAVRDYPQANRLLGDYMFSAAEIAQAVVRAVRYFNTAPPDVCWLRTIDWPRAWWMNLIEGVVAELYAVAASYFRANHLPYSAGGVSVDDMAKEKDYLTADQVYRQRWRDWVKLRKSNINVETGFGSMMSPYAGLGW
jgi:hypothetical protein